MINKMLLKLKEFLTPKKVNNLQNYLNIDGWLTSSEAQGLFEVAGLLDKESTVVEIGSWKGKSTWCIAQGLKSGTINCIDPFNADGEAGSKEIYENTKGNKSLLDQFKENLSTVSKNITIVPHKGYSNEFVGLIKQIDFLFIDGDHSIDGCTFDFVHFEKDLKVGGFVAFHDYYPDRADLGPTWVIDNLVKKNAAYVFHKSYDSFCVFKKIV